MIGANRQIELSDPSFGYHVQFAVPASPGFFEVLSNWDGQWYASIADHGYPRQLPMIEGQLLQNEWAFSPLFPFMVRVIMYVTPLGFGASAWILNLACSAIAVVLLYRMLRPRMGVFASGALLACFLAFQTAAILQAAYTESLAFLLIVLAFRSMERHEYGRLIMVCIFLSLTRAILLPVVGVFAVHVLRRVLNARRGLEAMPRRELPKMLYVFSAMMILAFLWQIIGGVVTGRVDAVLATLSVWPTYAETGGSLGGWSHVIFGLEPVGIAAIVGFLALAYLASRRGAAGWGPELRTWAIVYPLYLLVATKPNSSILRYFMLTIVPLWPLPDPPGEEGGRSQVLARWTFLVGLVILGLIMQYRWVTNIFTIPVNLSDQSFFP